VDLALVSKLLRVPSVQMQDYEHAGLQRRLAFRAARRVLAPDAIPPAAMRRAGARPEKLFSYPGLKEEYYLADFEPDPAVLGELGVDRDRVLAVVRPPPETSAYHAENPLYAGVIERLATAEGVQAVVIPRTERQATELRARAARQGSGLIVPDREVDAQSLIALADLVVSAGGTMNREAVALGTPVYTIFSGAMGAVDERLIAEGRLRVLTDPAELDLRRRGGPPGARERRDPGLLVDAILGAL
jgi:predicted glycosyltransferase